MLGIVEVVSNIMVLIYQVAALNWSDTIYPNLGYPRQKRRKSTFLCEMLSESTLSISDIPEKIMLGIAEVLSNVLVIIRQVAALNWSDTIYPNVGSPRQKRRKSTFLHEKWSESTLSISDYLETYVENSWSPKQRFGINQPSGRAQLKWHNVPKLRVPPVWYVENRDFFSRIVIWKYFIHQWCSWNICWK